MGVREEGGNAHADGLIARLASRQHGVISGEQLAGIGVRRQGVTRRVQAERLHRIHRGVYAVGHPGLSREGRWMAAVLACGPGAALSHTSAAELWGMLRFRRPSRAPSIDSVSHVTVPRNARSRRGIKVHRSRSLFPSQVTRRLGIPVTAPSRTLIDLRRTLPQRQFMAALRQAEFVGLPIDREFEPDHTRSELERRFLALCRRHRLPKPDVNVRVGEYDVDFLWPERALIAELDGYGTHAGRVAFEADRARDLQLKLRGYEVVRFTWRQLKEEPSAVAAALRKLLRK
jgi:very-short-patch-repair endonuclease